MEFAVLMVLLVVAPSVKKLVKSAASRNCAKGEAALIIAQGWADGARARGKAEIIKAKTVEGRRGSEVLVQSQTQTHGAGRKGGNKNHV
ncbi:hypothetical protein ACIRP2_39095 [Streptomyces sp. NPDC101194]|uniref:hypothetical protein n=1 Tax=Streptomyces sp. NPDC101194 TaxID=3366127 RepID=UPI0037F65D5E